MAKLINLKTFKEFFRSSSAGGIILLFCVVLSLIIANTGAGEGFNELLSTEIGFANDSVQLRYPVLLWINDGLMAIFFLLVGLEIKREIVEGELSSLRQASLPVLAAIGGVVVPALIYTFFNHAEPDTIHGWGIPMATDIAFALGILSLLGDKVPSGIKVFLAALAIVDDLMAILVIAIFYSTNLHLTYLMYAAGIFLFQIILNRAGVKNILFYIIPGIFMWYFIHHSGIHATIAGVLTALTLPTTPDATESPLEKLEHMLAKPVNFLIMPIFAIANTNITFEDGMVEGLASNLGLGIVLGLFLGKPIGIFFMSWLSVKLKVAELPAGSNWTHVLGLGLLGGIGFTMSIFIALLSFKSELFQNEAKFAVLTASVLSGIFGYVLLSLYNKKQRKKAAVATS
ncbi:Na+/H+ antiporter NhaA [Flavobacterium coralii]|uniref:Na+/H+ antiporter NhaA n=1 Tax=Flavobacterium coralii TaxID=2838017 RepID=UPI000C4628B6|nr:Na+/H+ antiporter NhaA [Flavobacterium sp.]|tara:strand:- start:59510 stop:60709 length:1200 start_codon:yes stop_codon:yes gene_type:complete